MVKVYYDATRGANPPSTSTTTNSILRRDGASLNMLGGAGDRLRLLNILMQLRKARPTRTRPVRCTTHHDG